MHRRSLTAISVGIAAVCLTQWALFEGGGLSPAWASANPFSYYAISNVLFAVASVFPGFCAGWISGRDGILLGALTGFIGSVTYSALFPAFRFHSSFPQFLMSGPVLITLASTAFVLMVTWTGGGVAGELLRSNNLYGVPRQAPSDVDPGS